MDQIVLSKFVSAEIHKSHIDSINLILEVLLYIFHCHILCFAKTVILIYNNSINFILDLS